MSRQREYYQRLDEPSRRTRLNGMAKGNINIGDEVTIIAMVRRRVTEDRVSVSIPGYNQPHSILDRTSKVSKGRPIELVGDVTHVDGAKVTVNLGIPVTVDAEIVTLKTRYVPPKRKAPLIDKAS
ncbi:hypothetical protein [Mesorhizobium sp. B3-1-8]|uniref:hypothetical protein n=1 Tax=unclassified Mesorhizobium TaxID=325217 RepID=UPI0032B1AF76